jgi:hypothetical protein
VNASLDAVKKSGRIVSLRGPWALLFAGILAVVSPGVCVLFWDRFRGPGLVRGGCRLGLIACAQLAALTFAGLAFNDYGGFFVSWSELGGVVGVVSTNMGHPPPDPGHVPSP